MSLKTVLHEDFAANRGNTKGKFIVLFFRLSNFFYHRRRNPFWFLIGIWIRIFHRFFIQWMMGIDLNEKTTIGKGLCIYHGQGLVMNDDTICGEYLTLRQNTTIGNKNPGGKSPVIGNRVTIGANSVIIGDIVIGDDVVIGAGTVVTKDLPAKAVVVGNPARLLKQKQTFV